MVVKPLKIKEIFVCEENTLEDSLEKQDISVEQEYLEISSENVSFHQEIKLEDQAVIEALVWRS